MDNTKQLISQFLELRGISPENKAEMLDMTEDQIPSVLLMKDAEKFIDRLHELLTTGKRILIYGDYDADGVCSTTIMVRILRELSKYHTGKDGKIKFFIPHRFIDGYGMSVASVNKVRDRNPKLDAIITVDNGIRSIEAIDHAMRLGYEVLVTDHHLGEDDEPNCDIIVNPNRKGDPYPFKGICGTAVAYKLMLAYAHKYAPEMVDTVRSFVDFVGIATVADVMPVLKENRVYIKQALDIFNGESEHRRRFAWTAMIEHLISVKKVSKGKIFNEVDFGFTFAPMINAQSRVYGIASTAVDLFLSTNTEDVREKVRFIVETNAERKRVADEAFMRAQEVDYSGRSGIVMTDTSLGEGYIGLVSGKLAEKYHRPTVVFTKSEGGKLKGSARAGMDDLHLLNCLKEVAHLTTSLGGHEGAAGLSIKAENYDAFKSSLEEVFDRTVPEDTVEVKPADFVIGADQLTYDLINSFDRLGPFGQAFGQPTFQVCDLPIDEVKSMGKEKNHLKIMCDGFAIILWNGYELVADRAKKASTVTVTGQAVVNEYLGAKTMQLMVNSEKQLIFK